MPTISVIVPVYRAESFLRKCTDSILQQTYSDLELLLIEDGSPDESGALCDAIADSAVQGRLSFPPDCAAAEAFRRIARRMQGESVPLTPM